MDMLIDLKEDGVISLSDKLKTVSDIPDLKGLEGKVSKLKSKLENDKNLSLSSLVNDMEPQLLDIYRYIDFDHNHNDLQK